MSEKQMNLFLPRIEPVSSSGDLEERFREFHRKNPHVYLAVRQIALDLQERGFRKVGMKFIFERLRWIYAVRTRGDDYRLNNNYTAFYARLLMDNEPELKGFFEVRQQRAA